MAEPFVMEGWEFTLGSSGHWVAEKNDTCISVIGDSVISTSLNSKPEQEPSEAVVAMLVKMEGTIQ